MAEVRKRGYAHQVQETAELHAGVGVRSGGGFLLCNGGLGLLLARLGAALPGISARGRGGSILLGVRMRMPVGVVMPRAPRRDPQPLIHGHKSHEPNQNRQAQKQVPVRLHKHELGLAVLLLAQEDLGEEVEQRVAHEPADGEGDHDGQGRRVNVGGAQGEEEVGGPRDVERREEGVDGGAAGEEGREEPRGEGRVVLGGGGPLGVEVLDERACLSRPCQFCSELQE